jgi:hypothetical protein
VDDNIKFFFGRILGEIYRLQQQAGGSDFQVDEATIFGLRNGIESVVDDEIANQEHISHDEHDFFSRVLDEVWSDPARMAAFPGLLRHRARASRSRDPATQSDHDAAVLLPAPPVRRADREDGQRPLPVRGTNVDQLDATRCARPTVTRDELRSNTGYRIDGATWDFTLLELLADGCARCRDNATGEVFVMPADNPAAWRELEEAIP